MAGSSGVVVVAGSLHYDVVVDAPRLPRRGETLAGTGWRPKFGGKGGNQAVAAARAGAKVRMAGAVGDDDFGAFLLARLDASGVERRHVKILPGVGSGMSVAISESAGDYAAVIVSGANLRIDPPDLSPPDLWEGAGMLLLQNEISEAINLAAARDAKRRGVPVLLNAAPARPLSEAFSALVDILVVNAVEAEQICGLPVRDLASAAQAAARLGRCFPRVVVTAGGQGLAAGERNQPAITLPALPVRVVSAHGAGDVFVGTLAAASVNGQTFPEALRRANEGAARHVSQPVEA